MKKLILLYCCLLACIGGIAKNNKKTNEYVILASETVHKNPKWLEVVELLKKKHKAPVYFYEQAPREKLAELKTNRPRYVAIVETPENIGKEFVMDMHRVSREIDEDIYADFLWGIITGYDASTALRMVEDSSEPLIIKDAVATITELSSGKWFNRFAWVDDHTKGFWGEKKGKNEKIQKYQIEPQEVLKKFTTLYEAYNPDLLVTAAHATENNLEMPFSLGNIIARSGMLYANPKKSETTWPLSESNKRKVYFAVGNCLIGNVNNTRESMAIAWMNGGHATAMIGYVVSTWHGRNGWGGLKYWLTTPGRYTLAEAIYLNQQDFLFQQYERIPMYIKENFQYGDYSMSDAMAFGYTKLMKAQITPAGKEEYPGQYYHDCIGFWYDRDVLAYYGDPKWNVRLQNIPEEQDFSVSMKKKGNKRIITLKTHANFSMERLKGNKFKSEHVGDLPFSYFFPERLNNPSLAPGQEWEAVVDENFLLIYNADFEPNKIYNIELLENQ